MTSKPTLVAIAFLAVALICPSLSAQALTGTKVLKTWAEPDKSGGPDYLYEITFDYEEGVATRNIYSSDGSLVESTSPYRMPRATPEEIAIAQELAKSDPDVARDIAAVGELPAGGFLLWGREGEACGPGTRCIQLNLWRGTDSVRNIVVDLVSHTVVFNNYTP